MQVNNSLNSNYLPIDNVQNKKDLLTDGSGLSDFGTLKAKVDSTQAQIDAYVAGTQNANETNEQSESSTQNYVDFAADVKRANNYETLVNNGVDITDIINRPKPVANEITPQQQENVFTIAGYQSTQSQIEAYQAGTAQAQSNNEAAQYVQNFNEFSADARRSEALNTYVEYNNFLVG